MSHGDKVARIAAQLRAHSGDKQVPKAGDLRHKDDKIDISDLT